MTVAYPDWNDFVELFTPADTLTVGKWHVISGSVDQHGHITVAVDGKVVLEGGQTKGTSTTQNSSVLRTGSGAGIGLIRALQ